MFCGVWMSQSFSGFHVSVSVMRPSCNWLFVKGLAGELPDRVRSLGHAHLQGVLRVGGQVLQRRVDGDRHWRTDVSTFTSPMRGPAGVLDR